MPTLTLVRHGQASFGAEDYDNLSALGHEQSELLGAYFARHGRRFDAILHGTLRRHAQTWEGIARGAGFDLQPLQWQGLNEYDSEAVIAAIHPQPLSRERTPDNDRRHFRLLRMGLAAWMQGDCQPMGMPTFAHWLRGITDVLDHVREHHGDRADAHILMVTSGGPISTTVGHVLGTSSQSAIEMNLRIRNTSLTELVFNPKRYSLLSFNHVPHLQAMPEAITFA